jgi:hypothetical protein
MESYTSSHDGEYDDDDVRSSGSLQLSFGYIFDHNGRSVPTEKRR